MMVNLRSSGNQILAKSQLDGKVENRSNVRDNNANQR